MPSFRSVLLITALALAAGGSSLALAQTPAPDQPPAVEKPAPYDTQLARLSEILGAVHYLRNLCVEIQEPEWRASMQELLDSEAAAEPGRRGKLTAAFNRGYRAFAAIHTKCTPAATAAEEQYRIEGATLATEIAARFGN